MKRTFFNTLIFITVLISFGFRGCDHLFCQILSGLSAVAYGNFTEFAIRDEQLISLDAMDCTDSLRYTSVYSLNDFRITKTNLGEDISYFCAVGDSGCVVWSPNGGNNWEDHNIANLTHSLYGLDFLNYGSSGLGTVVCGQAGSMFVSTDSGSGWAWEEVNTGTTENLNSVVSVDKSLFIVVGNSGTILKTYDQGKTWEDYTVGGANFNKIFNGGKVQTYGYLWIAGDNGRIFATTNYGISWFPQNSGVSDNLNDIQFRNQNDGIVVGDNGVVRYTTNGGMNWMEDPYFSGITNDDIISLAVRDDHTATALIRSTMIDGIETTTLYTVSSEPLSADESENSIPIKYSLEQNYPNPFNPSTKINYTIPQPGFVLLKVYDILGSELESLVNEEKPAGSYQVNFNSSQLSNGIYFYRLQAGSFVESKKMLLLK